MEVTTSLSGPYTSEDTVSCVASAVGLEALTCSRHHCTCRYVLCSVHCTDVLFVDVTLMLRFCPYTSEGRGWSVVIGIHMLLEQNRSVH